MLNRLSIVAICLALPLAGATAVRPYLPTPKLNTIHVATECNDGSESGSSGRGTCSHHGGEAERDHS